MYKKLWIKVILLHNFPESACGHPFLSIFITDNIHRPGHKFFFDSIRCHNHNLKKIVTFENFNQQYPAIFQTSRPSAGTDLSIWRCDSFRIPDPATAQMVASASLKLEHFAASFIVDADDFFKVDFQHEWPSLVSLALTSTSLKPTGDPAKIEAMLLAAAEAAMKMPQLQTMEIWNGRKGLAGLFKYQVCQNERSARITWRGIWELSEMRVDLDSINRAWKAAVFSQHPEWRQAHHPDWGLEVVEELLDETAIKSHGDAIQELMLSSQVIRPVSLQQIQREQKALKYIPFVE